MVRLKAALLTAAALAATTALARAEPAVVASIKPVHSLVAAVMDGIGEPTLIVDGAGSPHTYALKPSQAAALENADIVFWVGHELEAFLEKPIETVAAGAASVELVDTPGLVTLPFREGGAFEKHMHGDEEDHDDHEAAGHEHEHGAFDAHVWLDPENAGAMVKQIETVLATADPEHAAQYAANAAAIAARLDALTTKVAAELEPVKGKGYVVFHDAYRYFENRFGIAASGSITVSPEVIPGAERVREIQAKVKELGAACVFAEPQFEPKLVATVTEGTAARSAVLDPLGAQLEDGPDLYFGLIRNLAASMRDCLGGNS